jgi:hypothetical protein
MMTDSTGSVATIESTEVPEVASGSPRWFGRWLFVIVVAGIVMRIIFAVVWQDAIPLQGDTLFFQQTAAQLAHGNGYVEPYLQRGPAVATALHPPGFPIVLAFLDVLGIRSVNAHRYALAFISSGGIVAMGFLGRKLLNPGTGLVAAAIAALSPLWIQPSGKVLSESIYLVIIPILLLCALRCIDRPGYWRFAAVGLMIGVATLTRSEAFTLVVLIGIPLVLFASRSWGARAKFGLVLLAGLMLIVGPWLVRNEVSMGGFTLSTDGGTTLVGSYSTATFSPNSSLYGSFDSLTQYGDTAVLFKYGHPPNKAKHWTELTLNNALGHIGTSYARGHLSDLTGVMLAREGRLWGLYDTGSQLAFDLSSDGDGVFGFQTAGQYLNWVLLPLAICGTVLLYRRSRRQLLIVIAPIVATALTASVTFGSTRYRALAEPSIAVLAAAGAVLLVGLFLERRRESAPEDISLDQNAVRR